jgi:hypothetical protein
VSCPHGNWGECELCAQIDAAWDASSKAISTRDATIAELRASLAAVTRERDEARVNERRYLWLRDQPSTSCLHVEREDINEDGPTDVWYATNGVELDAFIDDALRDAHLSPKEQRND